MQQNKKKDSEITIKHQLIHVAATAAGAATAAAAAAAEAVAAAAAAGAAAARRHILYGRINYHINKLEVYTHLSLSSFSFACSFLFVCFILSLTCAAAERGSRFV